MFTRTVLVVLGVTIRPFPQASKIVYIAALQCHVCRDMQSFCALMAKETVTESFAGQLQFSLLKTNRNRKKSKVKFDG
jgi:hypothetical protein